jgi:hypothetical protein
LIPVESRALGAEDPETLKTRLRFAKALSAQGKHEEAEKEFSQLMPLCQRVLGPQHPENLNCMSAYIVTVMSLHKTAKP